MGANKRAKFKQLFLDRVAFSLNGIYKYIEGTYESLLKKVKYTQESPRVHQQLKAFVSLDPNNPAAAVVLILLLEAEFLMEGKIFFRNILCRQI